MNFYVGWWVCCFIAGLVVSMVQDPAVYGQSSIGSVALTATILTAIVGVVHLLFIITERKSK